MVSVVVIDDNFSVMKTITDTLELVGYKTRGTTNARQGVDLIRDLQPDIIICDINMPDLDGYSVLQTLREDARTRTIPFIFLTAREYREDQRRGMNLGADDYITKPFDRDELLTAIQTQLAKRDALRQEHESALSVLRRNIIYALPHELRTPLTVILGNAEILREDHATLPRESIYSMADAIFQHSQRLHRMFENYLVYAQIELIAASPKQRKALRNHVIPDGAALVAEEATRCAKFYEREADLSLETTATAMRIAEADLRKIAGELVDNAFKFSDPGSAVQVRLSRNGSYVTLTVRDQGRGMTAEQCQSIGAYMQFERTIYEQQGLGLGLVIAKRLTELHEGNLHLESAPGHGTTALVRFPI